MDIIHKVLLSKIVCTIISKAVLIIEIKSPYKNKHTTKFVKACTAQELYNYKYFSNYYPFSYSVSFIFVNRVIFAVSSVCTQIFLTDTS